MNVSPTKLIFSILTGFVLGIFIFFFDNTSSRASFDTSFSHFPAIAHYHPSNTLTKELEQIPVNSKHSSTQLWFFRDQPVFLMWAIMHVIGVALCAAVLVINFSIQKEVFQSYAITLWQKLKCCLIVIGCIAIIMWMSYSNAYGFDYVAYLIPLNHPEIKIYSFEGLNYLTGAYGLINMMWITVVVEDKVIITHKELKRLKQLFHICLFMVAIVIAYATFASGVSYKALNTFFYKYYDPSGKLPSYFPVIIIITLGLINTFLLSMFYFPNALVFVRKARGLNAELIPATAIISAEEATKKSFLGMTSEMVETIKILIALLLPLLSGIFS